MFFSRTIHQNTMHLHIIFLLLLLHTVPIQGTSRGSCIPRQPLTPTFCRNPPTVPSVSLPQYTGTWYQLGTTGTASEVSRPFCTTANYTLKEPEEILVQNCGLQPGTPKVSCLAGVATRREGGTTAQLQVSFSADFPGQYNVAALLGNANYGYFAAVVYSCSIRAGVPTDGFFFIARTPFNGRKTIKLLKRALRCKGYQVPRQVLVTNHDENCEYFFGPRGFDPLRFEDIPFRPSQMES